MQSGGRVVLSLKYVVSSSTSSRSQLRLQRRLVDMMAAVTERERVRLQMVVCLFCFVVLLACSVGFVVCFALLLCFVCCFESFC